MTLILGCYIITFILTMGLNKGNGLLKLKLINRFRKLIR